MKHKTVSLSPSRCYILPTFLYPHLCRQADHYHLRSFLTSGFLLSVATGRPRRRSGSLLAKQRGSSGCVPLAQATASVRWPSPTVAAPPRGCFTIPSLFLLTLPIQSFNSLQSPLLNIPLVSCWDSEGYRSFSLCGARLWSSQ